MSEIEKLMKELDLGEEIIRGTLCKIDSMCQGHNGNASTKSMFVMYGNGNGGTIH